MPLPQQMEVLGRNTGTIVNNGSAEGLQVACDLDLRGSCIQCICAAKLDCKCIAVHSRTACQTRDATRREPADSSPFQLLHLALGAFPW